MHIKINPKIHKSVIFSSLLLCASMAFAAAPPELKLSQEGDQYTIPLGFFEGEREPMELRGSAAEASFNLPVSPRLHIHDAALDFTYTNSISLIPRSLLAVTLDKRILAQYPLKASMPDNTALVSLPAKNLFPGYRALGFRAAQHYTDDCEDGFAPELFTQIDRSQSVLRIKATPAPIQTSLARLGDVFDSRLWIKQFAVNIVAAEQSASSELLEAASLSAQGVALRLDFVPMRVSFSYAKRAEANQQGMPKVTPSSVKTNFPGFSPPPGNEDVILVGTKESLTPYLAESTLKRINSGYIGIFQADNQPSRAILVISGTNAAEVKKAAGFFSLRDMAFPERSEVTIEDLRLPENYQRAMNSVCPHKGCIYFSEFGFRNTTMRGMYPKPAELTFWAFPQMFGPQQLDFNARINFAYGAGFDKKSALNVILNGQFVQAIHLGNIAGEQFRGASIKIPVAALQDGRNVLSFLPTMIGLGQGGRCVPIFTEHLFVSILENSTIELPPMDGFMRLPDLNLFSRAGLPYTLKSDAYGSKLLLLDNSEPTLSAALTLLGKLAQVTEKTLTGIQLFSDQTTANDVRHLLVVGAVPNLNAEFKNRVSAFIPKRHWQTIQLGAYPEGIQAAADAWWARLLSWLKNPNEGLLQQTKARPASAEAQIIEGLGLSSAAIQFHANGDRNLITLFTAADAEKLQSGMERLVRHETWAELQGNGMLWDPSGEAVSHSFPDRHVYVGNIPQSARVSLFLSDRSWLTVALAGLIILLLGAVTWVILRRRAKRLGVS
ncbi:MAG: cellulose biosynthesis cyclic di-GMP-binding regulatory protein BcsB [Pseudomonadota bacterium]